MFKVMIKHIVIDSAAINMLCGDSYWKYHYDIIFGPYLEFEEESDRNAFILKFPEEVK